MMLAIALTILLGNLFALALIRGGSPYRGTKVTADRDEGQL